MRYDFVIVGAGLFGSVWAHEMTKRGKSCLVIEKRNHIGGNIYTENVKGIEIHKYGAHIFHTSDKEIWDYVNKLTPFEAFVNSPMALTNRGLFNLPFNMNTFNRMWNVVTPQEAKDRIKKETLEYIGVNPVNLEEQALKLGGREIYETFIRDYTIKQWNKHPTELPPFLIKRLPFRFTYDNNYFNDEYQGIPKLGYTSLASKLLEGSKVILETDYFNNREYYNNLAKEAVIYTGKIDQFFGYEHGRLNYRSLKFIHEHHEIDDYQGNAVINYNTLDRDFTRIIEHKHFIRKKISNYTIITKEYPADGSNNNEPYYPINTEENQVIYKKYRDLAKSQDGVIFGGRLAEYKYYDMHQIIARALKLTKDYEFK